MYHNKLNSPVNGINSTFRTIAKTLFTLICTLLVVSTTGYTQQQSDQEKETTIAILLYDKLTVLDAVGPYEVLQRLPNTKVMFVGKEKGLIESDKGMLSLHADYTLAEVTDPDIVIIPGGREGTAAAAEDPKILEWVKDVHKRSTYTTSICTGTFILGAAGLLEDLKVTTHWAAKENLENRFDVTYVPERYVRQGKIITAAGVSAGIDMALYLAKELAGEKYAQAIQLLLEYDPAPPFDTGSEEKAPAEVREFMKTMGS